MLRKPITYLDFFDEEHTEDYYFNVSASELAELELSKPGGMVKYLQDIVADQDGATIVRTFKEIIKLAYGVRSADGKSFVKNDANWEAFAGSNAYDVLFLELVTDSAKATEFINAIMPKDLKKKTEQIRMARGETTVELPQENDPTPWITENREPTNTELLYMTKEQMSEAMRRRIASK